MKLTWNKISGAMLTIASVAYIQVLTNILHEKINVILFALALTISIVISASSLRTSVAKIAPIYTVLIIGYAVSILGNLSFETISFYKSIIYLSLAMLAWSSASEGAKDMFLTYISHLAIIASFSLVAGSLYALNGGKPNFTVINPDGFENSWYLLTFSRENLFGVIRGSWIFDEPGTLSFFMMTVVIARELLNKNKIVNIVIATCGLLTFSTAHLIATLMLIIYYLKIYTRISDLRVKLSAFALIFVSALSIIATNPSSDLLTESLFFSRIKIEDGIFEGNNRANQVQNYLENIDLYGFLFGEPECYEQSSKPKCVPFSDQTSNIFTPIFYSGLLASSPFYILYFYLIFQIITNIRSKESILLLIMLAILFQRPYFYNPNYILLGMISLRGISNKSLLLNMLLIRKGLK